MKKEIIFAEKYGVCSGVKNALTLVNKELTKNSNTIYVYHEIVHNSFVINNLQKQGVVFTENFNDIPEKSTIIFSAHGVSKDIEKEAADKNLQIIDGSCPLVKKNHRIVEEANSRGDYILFIGDKNHAEVIGTCGRTSEKEKFFIISSLEDIEKLPEIKSNVILLCQTTLSTDDVLEKSKILKQKYPQLVDCGGICHATDSRQTAIKKLAKECDLILVIGSQKSANSKQLAAIAENMGTESYLLENSDELHKINFDNAQKIGITAGASTPQEQIDLILSELHKIL